MDMFSEMFKRLNLNVLSNLLLHGTSAEEVNTGTYEQRLRESEKTFLEGLNALALEPQLHEQIVNACFGHLGDMSEFYFELGMKAGATLYRKLVEFPPDVQNVVEVAAE